MYLQSGTTKDISGYLVHLFFRIWGTRSLNNFVSHPEFKKRQFLETISTPSYRHFFYKDLKILVAQKLHFLSETF